MGLILFYLLIFFGIAFLLATLFLNTLSKTFKAIAPRNRTMQPGKVWLLLIPVFNLYWVFVVIHRLAASIRNEYISRRLGVEESPTYYLGLICATLFVTNTIITAAFRMYHFSIFMNSNPIVKLLSTAQTIVWIAYWLKVHSYKKHLEKLPPIDIADNIFQNKRP